MSNLFDPRVAAAKAGAIGARGLPPAPPGTRVHPQPNTQPMLPLQAPLAAPQQHTVAATPGGTIDVVHPGQQVPGPYKFAAYMRRGQPSPTVQPITRRALKVLQNPDKNYPKADPATKLLLARPGPDLQAIINSDPEAQAKHAVVLSKMAKELALPQQQPSEPAPSPATPQQRLAQQQLAETAAGQQREAALNAARGIHTGALEQLGQRTEFARATAAAASPAGVHQQFLSPQDAARMQQAGFVPWAGNLPARLLTETGQTMVGLGPGLAMLGYGLATNPGPTAKRVGGAIAHSYGETIHHPGEQIAQDPLGFVTNVATAPFAVAGGAARAVELSRAGQLAEAAGTSVPRQVAKTLIRPQPQERRIAVSFGGPGKIGITPPAYKSALGGYLQKYVLDPLLERHIQQPNPHTAQLAAGQASFVHAPTGMVTATARFGRKLRQDFENDIRIRAGAYHGQGMDEGAALSRARGEVFHDRWKTLYNAGASHDQALQQPWRDWLPIRKPPDTVKINTNQFDSEAKLSGHFGRGGMVPTRMDEAKDPTKFSYLPAEMVRGMTPYNPLTGHGAGALNVINRGTQLIRTGRFMTPAYAQWAVQNGLIHASQAGPFLFRNAWQLRNEWPQLPKDVQGAIDGGLGGGISRATTGGTAETTGVPTHFQGFWRGHDRFVSHLQEFWHRFDDQWARRMSAIHELNHAGFHNADEWENLYRTNPQKFRQIIGGQANREAINYTEMTPTERSLFARLFTAYGWTRGSSTYAARFALQHPVQARVGIEAGHEGAQKVNEFYQKLGGMAPSWMREMVPFGANRVLGTQWLNPAGTLGNV